MTDRPLREPIPPDVERDRLETDVRGVDDERPDVRPSAAEGAEDDAGPRPPPPSQAEGERDT